MDSVANSLANLMPSDLTGNVVDNLSVSRSNKEPARSVPHFSVSDTISISIYSLPPDYLGAQSLHFRLQELRIIAR